MDSEILHIIDSDDENNAAEWNPTYWIAQGRIYENVPAYVEAARHQILQLPASIRSLLPSKSISIAQLLLLELPPIAPSDDPMDPGLQIYTTAEPTENIQEVLPYLALPSRTMLHQMVGEFGQAWLDGKKSLRTWFNPDVAYPLWALTYWQEMLDISDAKDTWLHAESWLSSTGRTPEEAELKLQVRGIWSVAGWHANLAGFSTLSTVALAELFSDNYLDSRIVDAMLTLLALRARIAGEESLIIQTSFSDYIRLLPPIVDGVATGPITAMAGGQKYLKKYGDWFQLPEHKRLHTVLYRPPKHWTATSIHFDCQTIQYGDGLKWNRPEDFFTGLQAWIHDYHGAEFTLTDDLPCARQTDGFNCPIIAVNMIAHSEFGDPLWTTTRAKAMRMKAFCDIMKHALSTKRIATKTCLLSSVDADFNDDLLLSVAPADARLDAGDQDTYIQKGSEPEPRAEGEFPQASGAVKRSGCGMDDVEKQKRKIAKTTESSSRPARTTPLPFFTPEPDASRSNSTSMKLNSQKKATAKHGSKSTAQVDRTETESKLVVGVSRAATAARRLKEEVKNV
ncbi:hypothetical protein B0H11DRAFT_2255351 [Mycena galericulata]|nr:hypothetical protein B0H11DRAFT_2255351 [Mycena galericulata]